MFISRNIDTERGTSGIRGFRVRDRVRDSRRIIHNARRRTEGQRFKPRTRDWGKGRGRKTIHSADKVLWSQRQRTETKISWTMAPCRSFGDSKRRINGRGPFWHLLQRFLRFSLKIFVFLLLFYQSMELVLGRGGRCEKLE